MDLISHSANCKSVFENNIVIKFIIYSISDYTAASTSTAAYIIGGVTDDYNFDSIYQFKDYQWSHYDKLHQGRLAHGSITVNGNTMILGGHSDMLSE